MLHKGDLHLLGIVWVHSNRDVNSIHIGLYVYTFILSDHFYPMTK